MKEAKEYWRGREITLRFEVFVQARLVYAYVYDKRGRRHMFIKNDRGVFIGTRDVHHWPDDLVDLANTVLLKQTPVEVLSAYR